MAETEGRSLDDFFAKRDKKKKKEKVKGKDGVLAPADGASSALASSNVVLKKGRKEREKSSKNEFQDIQQEKEDEEWKEFEQKETDYTGLRIQSLQLVNEKEEEENEKKEEQSESWDETLSYGSDRSAGPWNKPTSAGPPAPPAPVEVPESKPSGVYRPPGARLTPARKGPPQGPPEIFSDAQFPSLQATAKHVETRKDKEMDKSFEMVKHRNRGREEGSKNPNLQLQLDNQYAVLGDQ